MYLTHPAIDSVLISFGPLAIRWYSLMYIFGFLFFFWWTTKEIRAKRINFSAPASAQASEVLLNDFLFYGMLGVLIGGRLGYIFLYNFPYYLQNPSAILKVWEGGMSFHGAFIGTYIGCWICIRNRSKAMIKGFSLLDFSDITLVSVPLGLAFGRLGNFINGELYGRPASVPWAMYFPRRPELGHVGASMVPQTEVQPIIDALKFRVVDGVNAITRDGITYVNVPRHPSQLYHFLLEGMLTFFIQQMLYYKCPASKNRGFLTGSFLISYGISRFIVEFFRMPDAQIGYLYGGWLTAGMIYTLPMIFLGGYFVMRALNTKSLNLLRTL
ncbi:MAG: prolipoprotein diacylglyceryl transferase [Brevinema sp.]